jgi:MFS family permease
MALRPAVGGFIDRVGARPVILPGIAVMGAVSIALQLPRRPEAVIGVMAFGGIATALINTTANVLTARASTPARRGEAMGLYYLASSLAIAVAPPVALALYRRAGMPVGLAIVTGLTLVLFAATLGIPRAVTARVAGARAGFRLFSRHALPVTPALVLTTMGYSAIYAFVPLYAIGHGQGAVVVWFFTVYSVWLIACRVLFGGLSDRIGRTRVAVPAMALTAAAYLVLAIPPSPRSLIAAAVLMGAGNAVLYPTLIAVVLDRTPDRERGVALGSASAAWDLGVVVGSALVGFVADRVSFGAGFTVAGVAAALGVLAFAVGERRAPRPAAAPAA